MTPRQFVPAYAAPRDDAAWAALLSGPPGIAVVTGDNSGPGTAFSSDLADRIASVAAAGWDPIAYVRLDRMRRPMLDITADVTAWRSWYPRVKGVFWDECPGPQTGVLEGALLLEEMATRLGGTCAFNPGVAVDARWFDVLKRSLIVTFEGPATAYAGPQQTGERCVHLVHDALAPPVFPPTLGWGFATADGRDGNPWDGVIH